MAKYSYERKKAVVEAYQNGEGGYSSLSSIYGVPAYMIRKWVRAYSAFGEDGLYVQDSNKTILSKRNFL